MRRKLAVLLAATGVVLSSAGCGETSSGATVDPMTTQQTPPTAQPSEQPAASTTSLASAQPPAPPGTAASPTSWAMPNLVGQDLQAAQNAIQALTASAIFFTSSTDATGQGRLQVVDSNWIVCSQNVGPGQAITAGTRIEFAAVKQGERCP
jgi:PASTA domain-containing protein